MDGVFFFFDGFLVGAVISHKVFGAEASVSVVVGIIAKIDHDIRAAP